MGDYSGTVPTILPGDIVDGAEWEEMTDQLTAIEDEWTVWVPTLANLTLGSGTVTARYRRVGGTLDFRFRFLLGAGSAVGTAPTFTLPYPPHAGYAVDEPVGDVILLDATTANRRGSLLWKTGSTVEIVSYSTTGIVTVITATVPHTWASPDAISCHGSLEIA